MRLFYSSVFEAECSFCSHHVQFQAVKLSSEDTFVCFVFLTMHLDVKGVIGSPLY